MADLGLFNDDDEELRLKAIDQLQVEQPVSAQASDLDSVPVASTAEAGIPSSVLKRYLLDPGEVAARESDERQKLGYVSALQEFLSPGSSKQTDARIAAIDAMTPQKRLTNYGDLLAKYNASRKAETEAGYLGQKVSPAVLAKYQELGIPVDENSTYGSLAAQEKGLKPIFDAIKGERDLKKMTEMFRIRKEIEQGTKDSEYEKQSAIPGMRLKPGFKPPEKTVEKVRAAKTTVEKMNSLIDEINNEVGQMDTMDTLSPINTTRAAKISALVQALNIQAKTYNDLGVLNGPDMMILTQQIGDPTTIKGILKSGGAPGIKTKLGVLKKGISGGFNTEARNAGFDVPGEQPETKMIKRVPHARNPKDGLWYPVEN